MLARLLQLHPHTRQRLIRLSREAERDGAYRVAKRLRAVVLNAEGHTSGDLAAILPARAPKSPFGSSNTKLMESRACWRDIDPGDLRS